MEVNPYFVLKPPIISLSDLKTALTMFVLFSKVSNKYCTSDAYTVEKVLIKGIGGSGFEFLSNKN